MIPLEGPSNQDAEFKKEDIEIILDITDSKHTKACGFKSCLEFRTTKTASGASFYKAFNDISQILEDVSTPFNNEEE